MQVPVEKETDEKSQIHQGACVVCVENLRKLEFIILCMCALFSLEPSSNTNEIKLRLNIHNGFQSVDYFAWNWIEIELVSFLNSQIVILLYNVCCVFLAQNSQGQFEIVRCELEFQETR